jgi:hypothetical protein
MCLGTPKNMLKEKEEAMPWPTYPEIQQKSIHLVCRTRQGKRTNQQDTSTTSISASQTVLMMATSAIGGQHQDTNPGVGHAMNFTKHQTTKSLDLCGHHCPHFCHQLVSGHALPTLSPASRFADSQHKMLTIVQMTHGRCCCTSLPINPTQCIDADGS